LPEGSIVQYPWEFVIADKSIRMSMKLGNQLGKSTVTFCLAGQQGMGADTPHPPTKKIIIIQERGGVGSSERPPSSFKFSQVGGAVDRVQGGRFLKGGLHLFR